jgi:hypothetical protein
MGIVETPILEKRGEIGPFSHRHPEWGSAAQPHSI